MARPNLGVPLIHGIGLSIPSVTAVGSGCSSSSKTGGKSSCLNVRFDERRLETESRRGVRHRQRAKAAGNSYPHPPTATAPVVDSTDERQAAFAARRS